VVSKWEVNFPDNCYKGCLTGNKTFDFDAEQGHDTDPGILNANFNAAGFFNTRTPHSGEIK